MMSLSQHALGITASFVVALTLLWAFFEHREKQIEGAADEAEDEGEDEPVDDEETSSGTSPVEADSLEETKTLYRTTVTYRNGDTEEWLSYGLYEHKDHHVVINNSLKARRTFRKGSPYFDYHRRKLSVYTLAREPEFEPVATETWRLHYEHKDGYAQRSSLRLELVHATRLDE